MFSIPVKILEISGGGGDLPLMTWGHESPYHDEAWCTFSNLDKTIAGSFVQVRGNHPIVPDRWYLEIKINTESPLEEQGMYGVTDGTTALGFDISLETGNAWCVTQDQYGSVQLANNTYPSPLVYATKNSTVGSNNKLLSVDGLTPLESLLNGDVLQFCGDRSDGLLWIGLNGTWLYWGTEVYDELEEVYELTWFLGDPVTSAYPVFNDVHASPYVFVQTSFYEGGFSPETLTLLTHTDDLDYAPPTGFLVVSGDESTTYLNVLRDRNIMPISQPTDHTLMGALGL